MPDLRADRHIRGAGLNRRSQDPALFDRYSSANVGTAQIDLVGDRIVEVIVGSKTLTRSFCPLEG